MNPTTRTVPSSNAKRAYFLTTFHLATVSSLLGPSGGIATEHGVRVDTNMPVRHSLCSCQVCWKPRR